MLRALKSTPSLGLAAFVLTATLLAAPCTSRADLASSWRELPKEQKLVYANAALAGAIIGWGFANWDYGNRSWHATGEGWFGRDTGEGGADKLGHAYGTYVLSHAFTALYERWGYESDRAPGLGALSGFGIQALMEVGDGFSRYGFSWEDMTMNAAGALAGYVLWRNPRLSRLLDLRIEYAPDFDTADVLTDYQNQKYLLALKLDGIVRRRDNPLGYLELHLGYYARDYAQVDPALTERNLFVGVGINLSRLFEENGFGKVATVLRYYQPPFTSLQLRRDLNR